MGKGEWTDFPIFKSKRFFGTLITLRKMWSEELERGHWVFRNALFNPMQTNLTKMMFKAVRQFFYKKLNRIQSGKK